MTCIFLFLSPRLVSFKKGFKFYFEISFRIILKVFRLKSWFKFDYLKQFPESSRVEKSSKKLI
jgi:hypothetical protein